MPKKGKAMSFTLPLPGAIFHSPKTIADDAGRTEPAVCKAIRDNRIEAINIGGRWFIPDAERQRLLRDGWPSKNPGVTKFWQDWRDYRAAQRTAAQPASEAV
jgi:hypothetical protein